MHYTVSVCIQRTLQLVLNVFAALEPGTCQSA